MTPTKKMIEEAAKILKAELESPEMAKAVFGDTHNINDWPYPTVEKMYRNGDRSWLEVSAETYDEMLDVLPPIRMSGGAFMVGEAWDHDERGGLYSAYVEHKDRFFCRIDHLIDFDPARYKYLISRQISHTYRRAT